MDLFADLPEPGGGKSDGTDNTDAGATSSTPSTERYSCGNNEKQSRKRKSVEELGEDRAKLLRVSGFALHGHAVGRQGEREDMQDVHVVLDDALPLSSLSDCDVFRLSFYAVYDGHAGARAAQHCGENLHLNVLKRMGQASLETINRDIRRILVDGYKKTDEAFLQLATKKKPSWKDGTTATSVLVVNNTLYIANIGDSKAIILREKDEEADRDHLSAITLTKDHNPTDYEERMRIQKAGGVVRDGRVDGQLEVSRSIGDGPYKTHGVTCVPDVRKCQLTEKDRYLLIACDGLWKGMKNDQVAEFIHKTIKNRVPSSGGEGVSPLSESTPHICRELAGEAVRRLSGDNVTVLLVAISKNTSVSIPTD